MVLLSGCSHIPSNTQPDFFPYTEAEQDQAAKEMIGNACPMLSRFTMDYGVVRDQIRSDEH